jgi:hypothetical protein
VRYVFTFHSFNIDTEFVTAAYDLFYETMILCLVSVSSIYFNLQKSLYDSPVINYAGQT